MNESQATGLPLILGAALGGTLVFGFLDLLLGLGWSAAEPMLRERAFVIFVGNAAAAILVVLVQVLARMRPNPTAAYLGGMAVGFGAFVAGFAGPAVGFVAFLLVLLAARPISERLRLPPVVFPLLGVSVLLLPGAIWLTPGELRPLPVRAASVMPPAPSTAVASNRPDVLLIVADTLRADVWSDPSLPTPNLDALRERGSWSTAAVAPCNQTLPSHLSLLCGVDIEKLGMRSNLSGWPTQEQLEQEWKVATLAERLAAVGYRTAAVAANPLLSHVPDGSQDFAEGFEAWDSQEVIDPWWDLIAWKDRQTWCGWLTPFQPLRKAGSFSLRRVLYPPARFFYRQHVEEGDRTTAAAVRRLQELADGEAPYFLFLNYFDPHTPYIAPPPFAGSESETAVPEGYRGHALDDFPARLELVRLIDEEGGEGGVRGAELGDFLRARYREEVRYLDLVLGRLLAAAENRGRPTLVAFVGDHGEMFGEHGSVEHSSTLFQGEIGVPLVLAGPGVPAGAQLEGVPELVDVTRTLLRLCDASEVNVDGRVLFEAPDPQRVALSVMRGGIVVRRGPWKLDALVRYGDPPQRGEFELKPRWLFDLSADPDERQDLSASRPEVVAELLAAAQERLKFDLLPLLPARELSPMERDRLRNLGYADDEDE